MVDPWVLTNDVIGGVGSLIITPLLWIALFLWAWSRPAEARASGFGRIAFWLLLPGALLISLANAPFLPWAGDVLAINLGGALIPIALTLVLLHRELGVPKWNLTATVVLFVAAETAVMFACVLFASSALFGLCAFFATPARVGACAFLATPALVGLLILVTAGGTVAFAAVALPRWSDQPSARRAITFVGLVSLAVPLTYLTSQSVPMVGIVSTWPYYLIAPAAVGILGVWAATAVWGVEAYRGLGAGYGSATFGTLIGADVLRQPPLYSGTGGELLAIGGAGIQDLVYFSGLMALGVGLLFIWIFYRRVSIQTGEFAPAPLLPEQSLRSAAIRLARGDPAGAIQDSVAASQEATDRVRSLFRLPPPVQPAAGWDGLPVAPYVANDYRNFVAATQEKPSSPREAFRTLAMATQFVRLGRDLARLRFAAPNRRAWAAIADLLVVTAPAVAVWAVLALTLPGTLAPVLDGLPFNLAAFAFVGYGMLYYVVGDALFGVTVGKWLLHLTVTDRSYARPTWVQSFVREAPKAVPIYVIGEFGAPALLFLLRAHNSPFSVDGITLYFEGAILLGIVLLAVGIALSIGGIQVLRDSERQRLGDRWASTWVVDRREITPPWGATRVSPVVPPEAAPSG